MAATTDHPAATPKNIDEPESGVANEAVAVPARRIKIRTTLPATPLPPQAGRLPLETERLALVPISQADLADYHEIRTQPAYMVRSARGRVNENLAETQKWLDRFLPPNDGLTYAFAIRRKGGTAEGEAGEERRTIGMMGIVRMNSGTGWPEIGYGINPAHQGRGYATELLCEVVRFWWTLPRREVVVEMEPKFVFATVGSDDGAAAAERWKDGEVVDMPERVMAIADAANTASLRVMEKLGFTRFTEWDAEDDQTLRIAASWLLRPT
ncbi:GNAT family N-acetyltransferase [Microdochium nivale]|nr:GNAT family N-acetyltransferase [Microdochium nivale]